MLPNPEMEALFRRMPVALYRTAPDGALLASNTALANLLGYSTVEDLTAGLESVDGVYVDREARSAWVEEITSEGFVHEFDVELIRPDGSTVWVQDTARAIRADDGSVLYFEGALIDVTEKVHAKKAKDEFVATISHELRNPIAVMLGLGEELANNYETFSDEDRQEMAYLIARQAEDASWLIEDLLVAYRDDVGRIVISPQPLDVTKQVERVLEVVERVIPVEVTGDEPTAYADPRRTRQILRNLVVNAIRYGGSAVDVQIEQIGDRVEVRVRDDGEPIPTQEVERIFKPFETGSDATHPKSVGLGLSVARKLARLMDGDLIYRHVEGRSNFVLSLPAG
ncbi:MAG: PAS domain-containing sensor histidine kinase [Actinomycetota bacterium]|nr:PAS domain-containing sensor histidine kinase [Actinomycetota bacterium]